MPVQTHTLKSRGVKNVKPTAEALLSRRHSEYRASTLAAPSDHAGREQLQPEVSLPPRRTPTLPARLRQVGCLSTQRRRWRLRRARCLVDRNFSVRFFPIGNSGHSRQVITLLCVLNLWQQWRCCSQFVCGGIPFPGGSPHNSPKIGAGTLWLPCALVLRRIHADTRHSRSIGRRTPIPVFIACGCPARPHAPGCRVGRSSGVPGIKAFYDN